MMFSELRVSQLGDPRGQRVTSHDNIQGDQTGQGSTRFQYQGYPGDSMRYSIHDPQRPPSKALLHDLDLIMCYDC